MAARLFDWILEKFPIDANSKILKIAVKQTLPITYPDCEDN